MAKPKPFNSIDELVTLLQESSELATSGEPTDAFTAQEIAIKMKCTRDNARKYLLSLQAEGRLEVVHVHRRNLAGHMASIPAYRLVK